MPLITTGFARYNSYRQAKIDSRKQLTIIFLKPWKSGDLDKIWNGYSWLI